jgi:hypothetical protein
MKVVKIFHVPSYDDPRLPNFTRPIPNLKGNQKLFEFQVVYKLKGNKHHYMHIFGVDEIDAYTKATETIKRQQNLTNVRNRKG